jgi:formate dehydrogenase subunit delta
VSDYLAGLERMANQIARNFAAQPDDDAAAGVADHLQRFWDPTMRRDLAEAVASDQVKVSPAVRDAIRRMADSNQLTPANPST